MFRGQKEYLIKWSGLNEYGEAWDDTWEPAEFIEKDGAEELERFFAKRKSSTSDLATNGSQTEESWFIRSSDEELSSSDEEEENELEKIKKYRVLR